jgi:hypothetical protein
VNGPPDEKRPGGVATRPGRESGCQEQPATNAKCSTNAPWSVYCVKHDGRRYLFQRYVTRGEADAVVATLQRVGCAANVEETLAAEGELPEHRSERRRFIVWAVLAGFAKPERLTEAVVREIEGRAS